MALLTSPQRSVVDIITRAFPLSAPTEAGAAITVEDWDAVATCAERQGLTALLYAAVAGGGAALATVPPQDVMQRLRLGSLSDAAQSIRARAALGRLLDLFAEHGIPVLVLKGCALAATVYSNPAHRSMCDLDLLVRRDDLDEVTALLLAHGYRRYAESVAKFREGLDAEACFVPGDGRGYTVEPHWGLLNLPDRDAGGDVDWFWSHTEAIDIGGRQALIFTPEAQVIHLAAHLVIHHHGRGLRSALDMALLLNRYADRLDWPLVMRTATEFGLVYALRDALGYVSATWSVAPPPEVASWLTGQKPALTERLTLAATRTHGHDGRALLVMSKVPGLRGKATYAFRMLFPARDYMQWRYGNDGKRGMAKLYARRVAQGCPRVLKAVFAMLREVLRGGDRP